ncbi:MAG: ABC transporter substrate-binding protein [Nocardioides sp.]|nr:ABC transporter substrate-binding protein [Nocardioides sp.]MDN5893818.1 ABC transporter substrate-binding protein [Nocardioides sp.]
MRLKTPFIALATAGVMTLAACGGSGGSGGDSGDSGVDRDKLGDTGDAQDAEREGPVEIEGAKKGGTVKVLSVNGLNTMDPAEAYYVNTASILTGLVTRSLTQYAYDEESGQMTLIPDLATGLGTPNEDFTEWKFTIRKGAKFENGKEITADDVKFGMLRAMDRKAFPDGPAFANDYFEGGADYKGPYSGKSTDFDAIEVDGDTLTIKMSTPFPDMPYWGTFPAMGPVPEGPASTPEKYRQHPLASGPYKFAQYNPEKNLTLVRNQAWDPKTDPGRTQYPEKYVFDVQVESAKIDQILLADQGEGQTTMTYDDVLGADFRKFSNDHKDRLVIGGQPCTYYWGLDYRKVTDKLVREAVAWAYPYKDAILAGGNIDGVTRLSDASALMPPGTPGRKEYTAVEGHEPGTTDPAKAKALLEEAGAMDYELKFLFANDDPNGVAQKDVIVAALEEAGFKATPIATTTAELSEKRSDPDSDLNVRSSGWCSDWPAGSSWFPPVMQSTNLDEEGLGANYSVFSEPEVDDRIKEILQMPLEEQPEAWGDLDETIAKEYLPAIVTSYTGTAQAHGSKVNGHNIDIGYGMPTWKGIWVS